MHLLVGGGRCRFVEFGHPLLKGETPCVALGIDQTPRRPSFLSPEERRHVVGRGLRVEEGWERRIKGPAASRSGGGLRSGDRGGVGRGVISSRTAGGWRPHRCSSFVGSVSPLFGWPMGLSDGTDGVLMTGTGDWGVLWVVAGLLEGWWKVGFCGRWFGLRRRTARFEANTWAVRW